MAEDIKQIHQKLDKVSETLTEIQVSQARTEISITEHIRRTNLLEENLNIIKKEMLPIEQHVAQVRLVSKIFVWILGAIVTVGAALVKIVK